MKGIEEWLLDGWFHARGGRATQAKIVLIGIDDTSLNQLGKPAAFISPELAEIIVWSRTQGVAAIGLDLIIPQTLETHREFSGLLKANEVGRAIAETEHVVLAKQWTENGWMVPLTQWQFKYLRDGMRPTDLGFINITEDGDHFFRRQQLIDQSGNLHFALALYSIGTGKRNNSPKCSR